MLGLFTRRPAPTWHAIPELPAEIGAMVLHADGNYSLGPFTFDQNCSLTEVRIGDGLINKARGEGEDLVVRVDDGPTLRLKFSDGRWHYFGVA
jgi:hypothetical protein